MSLLSGIITGAELVATIGAAIDPSHHPFKRSLRRPGGPGNRPDEETKTWTCEWRKPTSTHYIQQCVNTETGKGRKVRIRKSYKKAYNKAYRAGKFPKGKRFQKDAKHPGARYAARKSRTWAAATGAKRKSKKK